MLKQSGTFGRGEGDQDRVMDSGELERERGITISAKNCSVDVDGVKVNIIDTPGHADFGGEVERGLMMVDGVVLLVDASEGPLPQTRFVLEKALKAGLKIIVLLNKIDRKDARPSEVLDEVYDLFIDLGANDQQIEFPVLYAIGKDGIAQKTLEEPNDNLKPLFEIILKEVPPPSGDADAPLQILVSNLGYSDYLGRLAIGKVINGRVKVKETVHCLKAGEEVVKVKVSGVQKYGGLGLADAEVVEAGDIAIIAGSEKVDIGDTIASVDITEPLPRIEIDEPTISMFFGTNTSPFAGMEGEFVQARKIEERLLKETRNNVALSLEKNGEAFTVKGRGEFQMAILAEQMRREGFEFTIGRPQIIFKEENGQKLEPVESVVIDVDEEYTGIITEKLAARKGSVTNIVNNGTGRVRLEFKVPSRGLVGYRGEFLTDTRGTGLLNASLESFEPYMGDISSRRTGGIISDRQGEAVAYGLFYLEPRGKLFVRPGDRVYQGMIVGEHAKDTELFVNPTKEKKLSNMRASGKDQNITLTPVIPMTIEKAIEFIEDDEMVEVTPENIRLRKVDLSAKQERKNKKA